MPDLPGLPPLSRHPFPADDGRLDAALRAGRRRARRRLLAASPVVATAVALSFVNPGTTTTLRPVAPAQAPTEAPTQEPTAEPTATATPPSPSPKPTRLPVATPSAPTAAPTAVPTTVPPEDPEPTPARRWQVTDPDCPGYVAEANYCPNGDHTYFRYDKELTATARYAYVDGGAPDGCANDGAHYFDTDGTEKTPTEQERLREDAKRWCFLLTGDATLRAGEGARYAARVCRAAEAEQFTLDRSYHDKGAPLWGHPVAWAHLEVRPPGEVAERDHPAAVAAWAPEAEGLRVRPGDCVEWSMRWEARTSGPDGAALPPGEYTMHPGFAFANFGSFMATLPVLTVTVS